MSKKIFSPRLFKENDAIGKTAGLNYLASLGPGKIEIETSKYGVDLVRTTPAGQNQLECEVKKVWKGGRFPYNDVQVLHRKLKYFSVGADLLLVAGNHQDFCIIESKAIVNAPVVSISNVYVPSGELFFKVQISDAKFGAFPSPLTPNCVCNCGGSTYIVMKTKMVCEECRNEYRQAGKIVYRTHNSGEAKGDRPS